MWAVCGLVAAAVLVGAIWVFSNMSGSDSSSQGSCYGAKSSFCTEAEPEPDYGQSEIDARVEKAEPVESTDDCGGYSCKQLEKEAKEEQEQIDREIEEQLRANGIE